MRRLSHQLLLWFILIALVPFAIVAYLAYAGAERTLRAEVTNGLFAIARRQVDAIGAVVRAHGRNVTALSRLPVAADALQALEREEPRKAAVVKLRFFAGLTNDEAAESLGISSATAENDWAYARAWLKLALGGGPGAGG